MNSMAMAQLELKYQDKLDNYEPLSEKEINDFSAEHNVPSEEIEEYVRKRIDKGAFTDDLKQFRFDEIGSLVDDREKFKREYLITLSNGEKPDIKEIAKSIEIEVGVAKRYAEKIYKSIEKVGGAYRIKLEDLKPKELGNMWIYHIDQQAISIVDQYRDDVGNESRIAVTKMLGDKSECVVVLKRYENRMGRQTLINFKGGRLFMSGKPASKDEIVESLSAVGVNKYNEEAKSYLDELLDDLVTLGSPE